ncbi:MAG: carbohydrate ABC transporter permease [Eisenbergiella sp.]
MKQKKIDLKAYLFLLPAFVIFSSVVIIPTLYSFYLSFFSWNGIGEKKFVALKNYINLFTVDPVFITALKNNFIWILLTVLFTVTMSLLLAVVLNRSFRESGIQSDLLCTYMGGGRCYLEVDVQSKHGFITEF